MLDDADNNNARNAASLYNGKQFNRPQMCTKEFTVTNCEVGYIPPFRDGWFWWQIIYSHLFMTHLYLQQRNISSIYSVDSEADASELLENFEEMFPLYYKFKPHTAVLPFAMVQPLNWYWNN